MNSKLNLQYNDFKNGGRVRVIDRQLKHIYPVNPNLRVIFRKYDPLFLSNYTKCKIYIEFKVS